MIQMRSSHDCGPVALANFVELVAGTDPLSTYQVIIDRFRFAGLDGLLADLWDSPARHVEIAEALLLKPVGIPSVLHAPAVVLVHLGGLWFHWIVLAYELPGQAFWHIGAPSDLVVTTGPANVPLGRVVFAYAVGGPGRTAWWWRVWKRMTDLVV